MIFIPLILIGGVVGMFLEKIYNSFLFVLELVFAPAVFRVAVIVLLVLSVLLLAVLLFFLFLWKRAGRMSRAYRKSLPGPARFGAALVNLVLLLWVFWQCLIVLLCTICLTNPPFQNTAPASTARPEFNGSWRVTACAAVTPNCTLSQEEIDACVGTVITYDTIIFERDGTKYRGYKGLTVSGEYYPVEKYDYTTITADEFKAQYQLSAEEMGYGSYAMSRFTLSGEDGPQLGEEIVCWWFYWQGAFFQAEPINNPWH